MSCLQRAVLPTLQQGQGLSLQSRKPLHVPFSWHMVESQAQAKPQVQHQQEQGSPTVSQDQDRYKGSSKAAGVIIGLHRR